MSRSVTSLLQICKNICNRSADSLLVNYRFTAEHLQNVCRISNEYLQFVSGNIHTQNTRFLRTVNHLFPTSHFLHSDNIRLHSIHVSSEYIVSNLLSYKVSLTHDKQMSCSSSRFHLLRGMP